MCFQTASLSPGRVCCATSMVLHRLNSFRRLDPTPILYTSHTMHLGCAAGVKLPKLGIFTHLSSEFKHLTISAVLQA